MSLAVNIAIRGTGGGATARQLADVHANVTRIGAASRRTSLHIGRMARELKLVGGGGGGQLYSALGGLGLVAGVKKLLDYRRQWALIKAEANLTDTEAQGLVERTRQLSAETGHMPDQIAAAYATFQAFGGQIGLAKDIMAELAMFATATGTPLDDAATIAATLGNNLKMSKREIIDSLGYMNELAKAGQSSFKDVAAVLPRLLASATNRQMTGPRAVKQLGVAHQLVMKSFGTGPDAAARAETALDAMLRDLVEKGPKIRFPGAGGSKLNVFTGKGKFKRMRDLDQIMMELGAMTEGDPELLGKIFSADAAKAAAAFFAPGKRGKLSSDVATLGGVKGNKSNLETSYKAVTTGIGKPVHDVDKAKAKAAAGLEEVGNKLVGFAAENPLQAAAGALAGYLGLKTLGAGARSLLSGPKRGKGPGRAGAGALGAAKGAGVPVMVMNWPSGGGPGGGGGLPSGARELVLPGAGAAAGGAGASVAATIALPAVIASIVGFLDTKKKVEVSAGAFNEAEKAFNAVAQEAAKRGVKDTPEVATVKEGLKLVHDPLQLLAMTIPELRTAIRDLKVQVSVQPSGGLDAVEAKASRGRR